MGLIIIIGLVSVVLALIPATALVLYVVGVIYLALIPFMNISNKVTAAIASLAVVIVMSALAVYVPHFIRGFMVGSAIVGILLNIARHIELN